MAELFSIISTNTEKVSAVPITATSDASPQTVVTMTTPALEAGEYNIGYSWQATFGARDKPLYFKLGGTFSDANYFANAAGTNNALVINRAYFYPKDFAGGIVTMNLLMYLPTDTVTVDFADIFISRVG